eukprot:1152021-Pelagomonas_calceolata.AAC.9
MRREECVRLWVKSLMVQFIDLASTDFAAFCDCHCAQHIMLPRRSSCFTLAQALPDMNGSVPVLQGGQVTPLPGHSK